MLCCAAYVYDLIAERERERENLHVLYTLQTCRLPIDASEDRPTALVGCVHRRTRR